MTMDSVLPARPLPTVTASQDDAIFDRYLARIGMREPVRANDERRLHHLVRRHQLHVPFENLGIHAGDPLSLEPALLLHRIVDLRRGGMCYELNGAFAFLLAHLGYRVIFLPGRIRTESGWGPPYGHVALAVLLDRWWLVDVGFTDDIKPIPLNIRTGRAAWQGRKSHRPGEIVVTKNGVPRYAVRLWAATEDLQEFEALFWWHRTSPNSRFTQSLICTLPTTDGRRTLTARRLLTTTPAGRTETIINDDTELLTTYQTVFGIKLTTIPTLRR